MNDNQRRTPAGTPNGGRFEASRRPEVHLANLDDPFAEPAASGTADFTDPATSAELNGAANAQSSNDLDRFVNHENPYVRAEAASNMHLSADQAWRLSDDPDWGVRFQIVRRCVSELSEKMANDPDEVIRTQCLADPYLSDETRTRLLSDTDVAVVMDRVSAQPDQ